MSSSASSAPNAADIDPIDRGHSVPAPAAHAGAASAVSTENNRIVVTSRIKDTLSRASETTDVIAARLIKIKASGNPLLAAAQPLVRTLASLSTLKLDADSVPAFHALLVREIETFQKLCTQADLPREHVIAASYALCTALDEAANGTEWGGGMVVASVASNPSQTATKTATSSEASASVQAKVGVGVWAGQMLAASFHDDTEGGIKVFQLIGRLMTHKPEGHIDLLELLHRIMSLGFEGQYRSLPDGRRQHEIIRQRMYVLISQARGPVPLALSPHWQGAEAGKFKLLRSLPVWVTAVVLSLAAFGLFAWYKYQLVKQTEALVTAITTIGKMTPPPAAVASLHLTALLKDEIAQGRLTVVEDAQHSQVVFRGDDMFMLGQATINPKMKPLLDKVGTEIAHVSGAVQVIGHSDNQPIRTRRFPNNQVLSEERAAIVADALQDAGVAAGRLDIRGLGDVRPIADNATAAGRAKNRRVEIDISTASGPVTAKSSAMVVSTP